MATDSFNERTLSRAAATASPAAFFKAASSSPASPPSEGTGVRLALQTRGRQLEDAAQAVAHVVGQLRVQAQYQGVAAEGRVLADNHLPYQEIAEHVHAEFVLHVHRVHHVARGLGHAGVVHHPPAMGQDVARQGQVQGLEHGGPIDRMGGQDVLAQQVVVGGPHRGAVREGLAVHGGHIIEQGVHPHVGHVSRRRRAG